jgi:hypothetical protein
MFVVNKVCYENRLRFFMHHFDKCSKAYRIVNHASFISFFCSLSKLFAVFFIQLSLSIFGYADKNGWNLLNILFSEFFVICTFLPVFKPV